MSADDKTRLSPQVANTAVGTQLSGIYELDERIAFGGMGEVYRGHNIQTGDHVAIKIVLPEFARDQTILSLFRKEASILNHLSHDAVVRYHVFTIDPGIGRPYLAMEFVDGESLFDIMRRGPMPTEEVRKLCHRLASGLSAVHQAGAIHRDLSPDNIILPGGRVDRAKIIDFGIARSATVGGETLIGGKFAGKYNYVSPEQLGLYSGDVSEQSDIYSLGLVLAAALRGKPIDMGGSQFEIIEKRRSVPDLSDIDDDFRGIVEAMLEPDPRDRPTSMPEIARMTRGEDEPTTPPILRPPRDRPGLPRAGHTLVPGSEARGSVEALDPSTRESSEPNFVPHVRPAHLSQPRPPAAASPAKAVKPDIPARSARTLTIAIAALAAVTVVSATGAYLSGLMTPVTSGAGNTSEALTPAPEAPKSVSADEAAHTQEPAKAVAPAPPEPDASVPPVENRQESAAPQIPAPAPPAGDVTQTKEPVKPLSIAPSPPKASPSIRPDTMASAPPAESQADAKATQAPEPSPPKETPSQVKEAPEPTVTAPAEKVSPATKLPARAEASAPPAERPANAPAGPKHEPVQPADALPPAKEAPGPTVSEASAPAEKTPLQNKAEGVTSDSRKTVPAAPIAPAPTLARQPDVAESRAPEQPASQPALPKAAAPPSKPAASPTDVANAVSQMADSLAAKKPDQPVVALNVPKPEIPPVVDDLAQRVSWVRDFAGGDCFYATMISAAGKSAAIEGFGTAVQPFERMLDDFQAKFHVEPDISVRLIDPTQCEVTNFLRFLGQTSADKPQLVLDRTSVPNGTPISGSLVTQGGLISSVLLIDHKGMVFNLDDRIVAQSDKATFSIPIGLGAADKAAGKAVPQIIMVITGPQDIQAAALSRPTPASVLLPKILEEIETDGSRFSATVKYFRLGG